MPYLIIKYSELEDNNIVYIAWVQLVMNTTKYSETVT